MAEGTQDAKKSNQKRSNLYPRYDLKDALSFTEAVYAVGGENVAKESVAIQLETPKNSSAFLGRLSAAKQFGLIDSSGGLSITKSAKRILLPISEDDKQNELLSAFTKPTLYTQLIQRFNGKTLPKTDTLGNILVHEPAFGIEDNAKKVASTRFIDSANYAGAIKNGMLIVTSQQQPNVDATQAEDEASSTSQPENTSSAASSPQQKINHEQGYRPFNIGGILVYIPETEKITEAIMDGEFSAAKAAIKNFAIKYIEEDTSEDDQ